MENLVRIAFKDISLQSRIYNKLIEDIENNKSDLLMLPINEETIEAIRTYLYKNYKEQRKLVDALCEKLQNYQGANQKTF
ncbi:MAG: hypothetical protein N3G19_02255 [Candidatus Pacearchaeota archaeon]|nr:hypothetical protein [Candidatus Pacearchaeota archaeon]